MGQNMSLEEKVFACTAKGDIDNIRKLKTHGAGLEWRDAKGRTPLMYACNHAELYETAKTLLELGANVNAVRPREGGGTPLHHAARQGQERITSLLLSYNANPFILNDENETAHDIARRSGYVGVVRAIEQKIALFAAPMREQTGSAPGFLEKFVSQFIFTNVYVVVIPYRPDMHKPPTFYLLVYPSDRVASPKYRVAIEFAQLTVKKPDTPDAVLEVTDTATKSKFKLLEAPNERGQVVRLYNACKGLVPVNAPGTPPTPSKAPFPPMPASYTPQGASGAATPSSSRPSASGTPAARVSDHGKATDSEDEALAMAIAASLETAKLEPGAAASHDRYGGWADEESSEFGGWGGSHPSKVPPESCGPCCRRSRRLHPCAAAVESPNRAQACDCEPARCCGIGAPPHSGASATEACGRELWGLGGCRGRPGWGVGGWESFRTCFRTPSSRLGGRRQLRLSPGGVLRGTIRGQL